MYEEFLLDILEVMLETVNFWISFERNEKRDKFSNEQIDDRPITLKQNFYITLSLQTLDDSTIKKSFNVSSHAFNYLLESDHFLYGKVFSACIVTQAYYITYFIGIPLQTIYCISLDFLSESGIQQYT